MKAFWKNLLEDRSGQTLTEYALILALIVLVVIAALSPLGEKVKDTFDSIVNSF
jgi:pilus assembly protein Flp/PilA